MAKRQKHTAKYLNPDELERLFRAITDTRDRAIFRLAYHRGLRAREVGRIQLADWRPQAGRLFVRRLKGSVSAEHRLTEAEERALRSWMRVRGKAAGPLFPGYKGRGVGRAQMHVLMREYCAAAGIPLEKAHFHSLKHSCAVELLARGEGVIDVQDHLGHTDIRSTMVYAKLRNAGREQRAERLTDWR